MKTHKWHTVLVVAAAIVATCIVTGCVNAVSIIGSYNMGGDAAAGILTFSPDGTLTWSQPALDLHGKGTWTLAGKHLTISYSGGSVHEGEVSGNPFNFSVYGQLCSLRDSDKHCLDSAYGTTQFTRRFLGFFEAIAAMFFDTTTKSFQAGGDAELPAACVK